MVVVTQNPFAEDGRMLEAETASEHLDETSTRGNSFSHLACSMINDLNFDTLTTNSPDTILQLFSTGIQLQNGLLVKKCIEKLDEILDPDNVLKIYPYLPNGGGTGDLQHQPSAPPLDQPTPHHHHHQPEITADWMQTLISDLRHNCLLLIDQCADEMLRRRDILDLSYVDLRDIVERDSLLVSNELIVYNAIYCWGLAELQRCDLEVAHLRDVLKELPFMVRYGLLTKKEFTAWSVDGLQTVPGPTRSKLLPDKDVSFVRFHIKERAKGRQVQDLPHGMSRPRDGIGGRPKILSIRSASQSESGEMTSTPISSSRKNYRAVNTWEKCLINFLTCWTAVFD